MLALTACTETTAPELEYGNGRIDLASSRAIVEVLADSAFVGVPLTVRVTTIGMNSCWVNDVTRASISEKDDLARIVPYNRKNGDDCYPVSSDIYHTTALTFRTPGRKMIQVRALDSHTGKPTDVNVFVMVYQ